MSLTVLEKKIAKLSFYELYLLSDKGRDLFIRVARLELTVSAWKADRLPLTDTRYIIYKFKLKLKNLITERMGFEPTVPVKNASLASQCLKPLGHLSI